MFRREDMCVYVHVYICAWNSKAVYLEWMMGKRTDRKFSYHMRKFSL